MATQGAGPILGRTGYVVTYGRMQNAIISHGTALATLATMDSTLGEVNFQWECPEDTLVIVKRDFLVCGGEVEGDNEMSDWWRMEMGKEPERRR